MAATLSNASGYLKEFYMPGWREELNNTNLILTQVEKNTEDVEGLQAVLSLHVSRNAGVGARADMGTLPAAGSQGWTKERVDLKAQYGVIQISGRVIAASKSDAGSFIRAVTAETKGVINDVKRDMNRQLWGTSDGVIATAGTTTASTTLQLAATTTSVQMNQFFVNQIIDIATVSGGVYTPITNGNGAVISAIDKVNKTLTIGAAVTTTSADFVGVHGSMGSGASQVEVTGIQSQIKASGVLFGVDPASFPVWVSTVDDPGTNRGISENLLEQGADNVHIASGLDINLWIGSYGVRRAYANLLKAQKRFVNTVDLKGGYSGKGLEVDTGQAAPAALVSDRDAPNNKLWGLNTDHWWEYTETPDWGFIDYDGGQVLLRDSGPGGTDSASGTARKYMELVTDNRGANCLIGSITEA